MPAAILIVDDEPDLCWALELILKKSCFLTATALSGQQALDLVESSHFAAVFLDAKLPDMDGLELARHLRHLDPTLNIILVSGYFYQDDIQVQTAISNGLIRGFISKPFLQEEIIKAINQE